MLSLVAQSCLTLLWPHATHQLLCPFPRQESWSELPFLSLGGWFVGGLPNPGIKSKSPTLQANSLLLNYTDDQSSSRVRLLAILPGSSVLGISQARILEWVAISSSRGFPTQGLNPGWSVSSVLQADSLPLSQQGSPDRQIEVKVDTVRDN